MLIQYDLILSPNRVTKPYQEFKKGLIDLIGLYFAKDCLKKVVEFSLYPSELNWNHNKYLLEFVWLFCK